jgi:hypothetical protein
VACASASESSGTSESTDDALSLGLGALPVALTAPIAGTFQQQIDHPVIPAPSLGTFAQRYWYTTQYASGPDAPVILYIEGEAEASPDDAVYLADSAKSLGAAIVILEHRYYGESNPFPTKTLAEMKYLTIHNALEDLATFETWAKTNLPLGGKWVSVGGSYAGALSAFYRETHPELVVGAWASSSPVDLIKAFWGYDEIIARALGPSCTAATQTALTEATAIYPDPAKLSALTIALYGEDFTWPSLDSLLDAVSSVSDGAAQYGDQANYCASLAANPSDPLQGIALYNNPPADTDAGASGSIRFSVTGRATSTTLKPKHLAMPRAIRPETANDFTGAEWYYQVCTEVGFYQIYNPDRTMSVTETYDTSAYNDIGCQQFTGTTPDPTQDRATYFLPIKAGKVSNILFVSGTLDPWSQLTFDHPEAPPPGCVTYALEGGSHCEDLDQITPTSPAGVVGAHKKFRDLARQWLAQ